MKKNIVALVPAVMFMASCTTYTGVGTSMGAHWGSFIGSAIGGISGGYHGSNIGSLVGLAGGAAVGAAIGSAKDKAHNEDMQQYRQEKARLAANREARKNGTSQTTPQGYEYDKDSAYDSGFDANNSADDVIDLDLSDNNRGDYGSAAEPASAMQNIEIRNARFVDSNGDGIISRGEHSRIVFEIYNAGNATAYNLQPAVMETTGNKHILVSPSIIVESLNAHSAVRYTANIVADRRLKNGTAQFSVAVIQGYDTLTKVMNFTVQTAK